MTQLKTTDIQGKILVTCHGKPATKFGADTYIVRPLAGSPLEKARGEDVLAVLREANPKSVFVWVATPAPAAAPAKPPPPPGNPPPPPGTGSTEDPNKKDAKK